MSRTASGGRHAQPKRRASGAAELPPALTPAPLPPDLPPAGGDGTGPRAGRRRAAGAPRVVRAGGSHGARRDAPPVEQVAAGSDGRPVPWARAVAFSSVAGVAALTVGLSVLTDPGTASGLSPDSSPQQTAAVTVIDRAQDGPRLPVAQRSAPAEYAVPPTGRAATYPTTPDAPAPAAVTPTARPTTAPTPAPTSASASSPASSPAPPPAPAPAPAPGTPVAPEAPETETPSPAPEESPSSGLLDGLTGTLHDTVTGVVGVLPDLGG